MSFSFRRLTNRRGNGRPAIVGAVLVVGIAIIFLLMRGRGGQAAQEGGGGEGAAGGGPPAMPPMPVDVDTARRRSVVDAVRATGRIEALQAIELRPDEQGRVTAILFREGQSVAAGTPLVKIDDAMLKAQAERAKADRDLSNQQLERVRRLRAQNAASAADLERAEAAARSSEAGLALLDLQIARTTVKAPFGGAIGQRFVSVGDYVTTGTRLLTLQTVNPQRAVIEVPERYAVKLRPGQTVDFSVASQEGRTFRARVDFIDPVVQGESRTILVKASAPNPGGLLKPGMFIEARLATATRANAIVVPEDAVQPLRSANVVWAVVDGKASRRVVTLGVRSAGMVEIVNGVQAGEIVVVGGLERMGEGAPVAPRPRGQATPPATPVDSATKAPPAKG
ncbi:MAG TPA: efflux RND transporter periplasmic adaptor subunit [Gemmatimonadaceae bacterium]|nr:efflux RND transporter periplasmic adaptor subunit [Gemmatimonadaceae bacterium]